MHNTHTFPRRSKPDARLKLTALACAVGALTAGSTSWAQTLDGVVVSASRAEQRSFDAPAALDSVNRELIEGAGPQVNLSESLVRVPGLTILNRQNYAQDLQLSIRGFGSRAPFGIRGIRLLIDGIPATTPDGQAQGSSVALSSTERIEVLRGPLAQLYGNAAGGVIQAWTRDAPDTPEAGVQLHTGSFGMQRTVWQLGGKVGSVGVIADYSTFDTDGFRDNSRTKRKQFNSKISFGPSDQTRVNLVVNHFDMPLAQDPLGLTLADLTTPTKTLAPESARVRKITSQTQIGAALTHSINTERAITARAYTGTRDNLQYQSNSRWVGLDRTYDGVGLQYNAQNQVGDVPLKWVAGYEYDRSSERRQGGSADKGEKNLDVPLSRNEVNAASNSDLFFQGTAFVSERWSLIGGLRHSTVRFKSSDDLVTQSSPDGSGKVRYSATNPVLGVTWHAAETLNLYANWGKGFETPTLAEVAYVDKGPNEQPREEFNTKLNSSSSRHLEFGSKWTPSPESRIDLALFRVTTQDEIVVSRSENGRSAFKNAPGTTRTGLELSARTLLGDQWRASLSASTVKAKFSQSFFTTNPLQPVKAGSRLPGIPQHFVFGEIMWAGAGFADSNRTTRLGTQAGLELIDAGKLYANDTNTASAPGYSLVNLKASHAWKIGTGTLTAYARLDNATDRSYVGSVIVNQSSSQFYEPAPGRNWTAGLRLVMPL